MFERFFDWFDLQRWELYGVSFEVWPFDWRLHAACGIGSYRVWVGPLVLRVSYP